MCIPTGTSKFFLNSSFWSLLQILPSSCNAKLLADLRGWSPGLRVCLLSPTSFLFYTPHSTLVNYLWKHSSCVTFSNEPSQISPQEILSSLNPAHILTQPTSPLEYALLKHTDLNARPTVVVWSWTTAVLHFCALCSSHTFFFFPATYHLTLIWNLASNSRVSLLWEIPYV